MSHIVNIDFLFCDQRDLGAWRVGVALLGRGVWVWLCWSSSVEPFCLYPNSPMLLAHIETFRDGSRD